MEFDNTDVRPLNGQSQEQFISDLRAVGVNRSYKLVAAVMDDRYIGNAGTTPEQKALLAERGYEVL